jgi:hypothetical protein
VVAPSGTEYLGCQPVGCESLSIGVGQEYEIVLPFRITSATIGDGSWSIPPDATASTRCRTTTSCPCWAA